MHDQYSLLQREEEREMFPFLESTGVGSLTWSPLASAMVARPWDSSGTARGTRKDDMDEYGNALFTDADKDVVDAVETTAQARGVSTAQIGLAWVLHNSAVSASIIGATKEHHLNDAAAAVDIELTGDEVRALEEATRSAGPPTSTDSAGRWPIEEPRLSAMKDLDPMETMHRSCELQSRRPS